MILLLIIVAFVFYVLGWRRNDLERDRKEKEKRNNTYM